MSSKQPRSGAPNQGDITMPVELFGDILSDMVAKRTLQSGA